MFKRRFQRSGITSPEGQSRYYSPAPTNSVCSLRLAVVPRTAEYPLTIYNRFVDYLQMGKPSDLVQGTLDLLIMRTIALGPKHGWAIAKRIEQISDKVLQVQQGSLYPALHRLEQQGWIKAEWARTENGREAKFYSLTKAGQEQLETEKANWTRLSGAINLVLRQA